MLQELFALQLLFIVITKLLILILQKNKKYFSQKLQSTPWGVNQISFPAQPSKLCHKMLKTTLLWNQTKFLNHYTVNLKQMYTLFKHPGYQKAYI